MKYLQVSDGRVIPVFDDGFVELYKGVEVQIPEGAQAGDRWEVEIKPYLEPCPLTHGTLGDSVFISNNQRLLSEVKSNLVQSHRDTKETEGWDDLSSQSTYDHRSTKMAVHFNHLFLAKGRTLYWTDLDHIWNWYPRPQNEADFRTVEWESEDITALIEVNDTLFIHFPTAVYTCDYIGKPTIVRINQRNEGHGAVAQNCLVAHKNSQFYLGVDNFYQWTPGDEGIIPIGEEIWKRIIEPDIHKVIAYVDRINKEIHWVIGDDIWAFNYIERHWSRYSSNDVNNHMTVPQTSGVLLQQALDESGSKIEHNQMTSLYNMWSKDDGLYTEFKAGDTVANVCPRGEPFLVSDEQTYGDIFGEKDTDKVVVDANYGVGLDGFEIQVAAKKFVTDPDTFVYFDHWHHERLIKQSDSRKHSGRSLKFKFVVKDKIAKWDGRNIAEGHLFIEGLDIFVWNGQYKMDDKYKLQYLHKGLWDGGTNYINGQLRLDIGQFLLYAWGERVVLNAPPIGEDK